MSKDENYYLMEILLAIDQFGNALLGGAHDETISSVLGKMLVTNMVKGKPLVVALIRCLDALDENHCLDAIEFDEGERFADLFGKYIHHRADGLH